MKRVLIVADLHSGHRVGLTPPQYQLNSGNKWGRVQKALWQEYTRMVDRLKPIDYLICNGDSMDGKGHRSGGTELLTADRNEQVSIARTCLEYTEAPVIVMTHGTPYHVGDQDDWEQTLADQMPQVRKIGGQEWVNIGEVIFDCKHKIAGTSVPYSKGTAISKERLWNLLWTEHNEQPKAHCIIRSHIHSFFFVGADNWLGVVTPALQGQGSKYGSRQCQGHVDFGVVWFDIENGAYKWGWDIARVEEQRARPIVL